MIRKTFAGAQPTRTGGEERPRPACEGRPEPYDALMDLTAGPAFRVAQKEARDMCFRCELRDSCLTANATEPWAKAVLGKMIPRPSQARPDTNARKAAAAAKKWETKRAARLEELRSLIARGADLPEVLDMLGMTYAAFRRWTSKYAREELATLTRKGSTVAA